MLLKQAQKVHWQKWAARHECEELSEGVWLEPIQTMLKRRTSKEWTEKRRNVLRKWVLGG